MEQGSKDWHEWRENGIGSSDAPVIVGLSPWMTPYQLWELKTGRKQREEESNWAQARGNNLEPRARAHYETLYDLEMPATLVQHETYPFLRASLDGFNKEKNIVLEIKCPGKEKHALAKKGEIPSHYIPQLDHQLLVTGAACVHYFSFDGDSGVLVEHLPDRERLKKLLSEELEFWKCIEFDEAPPLSDKDFEKIRDKETTALIRAWKRTKKRIETLETAEKTARESILAKCAHPRMIGAGVRIQKIIRKGNIDYAKIPQLKDVNLEEFRKKPSESWRLDILENR